MPFIKSVEGGKEFQVRAFLAALFAGAVIGGFFKGIITADAFMGVAIMCISWYFAKRGEDDKKPTTPPAP